MPSKDLVKIVYGREGGRRWELEKEREEATERWGMSVTVSVLLCEGEALSDGEGGRVREAATESECAEMREWGWARRELMLSVEEMRDFRVSYSYIYRGVFW